MSGASADAAESVTTVLRITAARRVMGSGRILALAAAAGVSNSRYTHHFLEAGHPLGQLAERALTQRAHPPLHGHVLDLQEVFAVLDEIANGVVHRKDLEDSRTAEVAGVAAAHAAGTFLDDDSLARRR